MTQEQQETSSKVDQDDKSEKKEKRPTGGMRRKAFDRLKEGRGSSVVFLLGRSVDAGRFAPQLLDGRICLLASNMPGRKLVKGGYLLDVLSMLQ